MALIQIQSAIADRAIAMCADQCISFRIGINLGNIIEGDDIFGDDVKRWA